MKDNFDNGKHNYQDIGIARLCNAVVMQAVKDYMNDKTKGKNVKYSFYRNISHCFLI